MDVKPIPVFPNIMQIEPAIPRPVWYAARALSIGIVLALAWLLISQPALGIRVIWTMLIPLLPFTFFFAPGLWRNLCPLAIANQIPRMFNLSRGYTLSDRGRNLAYLFSITAVLALIPARKVIFNYDATALLALVVVPMVLALLGGYFFKGKSGWCGSFCPLAPVQRLYSQTPMIGVRNSFCEPCIGCSKNCMDFNPAVAYLADMYDKDQRYVSDRKFFAGAFPGLIYGFYNVPSVPEVSVAGLYGGILFFMLISLGAYHFLETTLRINGHKVGALFTVVCLDLYYWYNVPTLLGSTGWALDTTLPDWGTVAGRSAVIAVTFIWLIHTLKKEPLFVSSMLATNTVRVASRAPLARHLHKAPEQATITLMPDNKQITVPELGMSLLEILEANEVRIEAGCRMGMCGADPVTVLGGADNLSPPSDDEKATLERLGHGEGARMSCCARVNGSVTIELGVGKGSAPAAPAPHKAPLATDVKSVVIVGNGIAGVTAADFLRRNCDCEIHLMSQENHALYNRMGISRLIYGRSAMQGLYLQPDSWYEEHRITSWLNTRVTAIDRNKKQVVTGTGETISYDRLILACGSSSFVPKIEGFGMPGSFVLRTANHAMDLRSYIQNHGCRRAVVAGGGLLGLEAAYAISKLGLHVTVLELAKYLLPRQLDAGAAQVVHDYLDGIGIKVRYDVSATALQGKERLSDVTLKDGSTIEADIFLVAAGISPNIQLAKDAGLEVNRGVLVDAGMATSDPLIFAAGDIAEPRVAGGINGLWAVAVQQGEVAALNALGEHRTSKPFVPTTMLKVAGISVASVGAINTDGLANAKTFCQESAADFRYGKLIVENDILRGAILIGMPDLGPIATALVKEAKPIGACLAKLDSGDWKCLGAV